MGINDTFESGLELGLQITNDFINILQNDQSYQLKRIVILPDEIISEMKSNDNDNDNDTVLSVNDDIGKVQEVYLSKLGMKRMFLECYQCVYKNGNDDINALLGLLFITANDTTVMKKIVSMGYSDNYKLLITIGGYLTCSYDKTNKSSVLWTFFKKLFVSLHDNIVDNRSLLQYVIQVCLKSTLEHPRNYYACNSLRFFIASINNSHVWKEVIVTILEFLRKFDDYSIWMVLLDSVLNLKYNGFKYYRLEWERFGGTSGCDNLKYDELKPILNDIYKDLKTFVLMVGPYGGLVLLKQLHLRLGIDEGLMVQLGDIIETYKDKNININDKLIYNMKRVYG